MPLRDRILNRILRLIDATRAAQDSRGLANHLRSGRAAIGAHTYGTPSIVVDPHSTARVTIGKYCSIAADVTIMTGSNHNVGWISTYPFRIMWSMEGRYKDGHPASKGDVSIGNDVWIGTRVLILSGVAVGDGAVIGAGAVVVSDVPPYSIYAGNPARFVRQRFSPDVVGALLRIQWWEWSEERVREAVPLLCSPDVGEFLRRYDSPP